ncbi:hypothetical protein L1887_36867 [Cichorium endivia]|nr:hypothetical protein L1887_36867 [Cichorium endivia]
MLSDTDSDCFTTFFHINKTSNKIQRRFTDQQIKSLETIFRSESKLEPRKKLQVAKDLGLQPRQVAIWFQNKRARWKSKQLERDYNILRAGYDSLSSRFELLNRENQSLSLQLKKLHEVVEKKAKDREKTTEEKDTSIKAGDGMVVKETMEEGGDGCLASTDNWDYNPLLLDESSGNEWCDFWC